jgi:hypothetical protein
MSAVTPFSSESVSRLTMLCRFRRRHRGYAVGLPFRSVRSYEKPHLNFKVDLNGGPP